MKDYEDLMKEIRKASSKESKSCCNRQRARDKDRSVARIVHNADGTQRLVPASTANVSSPEFQRLLGPQGTLTTALGVQGVSPMGVFGTIGTTGPTGATCNPDPYFHFPNLDKDSGNCTYIPTFTDVPMTLSMAAYFAQAFLKEVSPDKIIDKIDEDVKNVINKVVDGNLYFNYVPIATLILLIVWVLVIHGVFKWQTGLFLTIIVIAVLWLGYLLLDTTIREDVSKVVSTASRNAVDSFRVKNEDIICNLLKGYYTAVNHMILPEAAICKVGATGTCLPIPGSPTGTLAGFLIPDPATIINGQIATGGDQRCNGINNNDTLIPVLDELCPCIENVDGFTLSNLTEKQKEELLKCIEKRLGGEGGLIFEALNCGTENSTLNPGLCALICETARCNPEKIIDTPFGKNTVRSVFPGCFSS